MHPRYYSPDEVASLLDLNVRTIRSYIRAGRLPAQRIGKQYRIDGADLARFTGAAEASHAHPRARVTSVVQCDDVDSSTAHRITTLLQGAAQVDRSGGDALHLQCVHEPSNARLTVTVIGAPADTARSLELLDAVLGADT